MSALAWDHNAYYHRLLLRQLPSPCRRVLDVGCGAGSFAARLAERAEHVDAIDRSPTMIEAARRSTPGNVTCVLGDVLGESPPVECYDAITSISALHHLPLEDALDRLGDALRPGGVLAVIGLPRTDLLREVPIELAAAAAHRVLAVAFAAGRSRRCHWYALEATHAAMPVILDPPLTTRQVRQRASEVLPGVQVRRLLFWRYLLLWHKPLEPTVER